MAKIVKILEACENFKLESEVALLESTELTELVRAQSKLMIHENMNYIKNALTKGGVLEETQNLLATAWTQVICEDINFGTQPEDDGIGAELAGAGLAAGGIAAGAKYAPAAATAYNQYRQQDQSVGDSLRAAGANVASNVTGDVNAVRNMAGQAVADGSRAVQNAALKADIIGRNTVAQAGQAVSNQVGAAAAGAVGVNGPVKPGTQTAYNVGSAVNKVRRAFGK